MALFFAEMFIGYRIMQYFDGILCFFVNFVTLNGELFSSTISF